MNRKLPTNLLLAFAMISASCSAGFAEGGAQKSSDESSLPTITRDEINSKLDKVTLVDALPEKFFERSHVKGSLSIPMSSAEKLAGKLIPNKDADIVVYCMNTKCHASDKVADELAKLGYTHVSIYREGLQDWIKAGLPAEGSHPNDPMPQKTADASK